MYKERSKIFSLLNLYSESKLCFEKYLYYDYYIVEKNYTG